MVFDCIIVGGGIAGLQSAIQLGRYDHRVAVIDGGFGRSTLCQCYHNVLGWPEGISGQELRHRGREHVQQLGVEWIDQWVTSVRRIDDGFELTSTMMQTYTCKRLLLATGIVDNIPNIPGLEPLLGISVYVCPDCDGYEVKNRATIVMGSGKAGVNMALTLKYWTSELTYVHHDKNPLDTEELSKLSAANITYIHGTIANVLLHEDIFCGVSLADGTMLRAQRAFVAFGGNHVKSELAETLGVALHHSRHILVDPRTKATSVPYVWAAGDVVAHSEQVSIAMGDGSQAAIWIHKSLLPTSTFPEKWPAPSTESASVSR